MRAVFYGRKSNDDKGVLGTSIRQQREWSKTVPDVTIVKEFEDQSVSGLKTDTRPQFMAMLDFCREQHRLGTPIKAIVTYHGNRFSRANSLETGWYIFEFSKVGVSLLVTQSRKIDLEIAEDRMILGIEQEATSHRFSVDLSIVTKRGKRDAFREGRWVSGKPPFGYKVVGLAKARKLEIDPDASKRVLHAFEEYASGTKGLRGIAEGLSTPDRPWTPASVSALLRNPVYVGMMMHGRRTNSTLLGTVKVAAENLITFNAPHLKIIPQPLFDRVQARFGTNKKATFLKKDFILTGLLKCANCSGPMCGRTYGKGRYYVCGNYNGKGAKLSGCNLNAVKEDLLIPAIARKLETAYFNDETMARLTAEVNSSPTGVTHTSRIAELDRRIAKLVERLDEPDDRIFEELSKKLVSLKDERAKLLTQQAAAVSEEKIEDRVAKVMKRARDFAGALKHGNSSVARALLRELIDRIEMHFTVSDGPRKRTSFARAAIYLHSDAHLSNVIPPAARRAAARGSSPFRPS